MIMDTQALLQAAKLMVAAAATHARTQGMVAENSHRLSCGESIAYGAAEFEYLATTLEGEAASILKG